MSNGQKDETDIHLCPDKGKGYQLIHLFVDLTGLSEGVVKSTRHFFEAHRDQIKPVFLPTYSPWLNLIERLWWQMRSDITRNHFFQTIQHTCQALVHWLEELPLTRFLSLIGIQVSESISSTS